MRKLATFANFAVAIPGIDPNQNFGELISKIYNLAIAVVGLAVFVQFLLAGFSYLMSAGNVATAENAKSKMTNAILGAVLLLSAYLILNVINPDLVRTNLFNLEDIKTKISSPPAPT